MSARKLYICSIKTVQNYFNVLSVLLHLYSFKQSSNEKKLLLLVWIAVCYFRLILQVVQVFCINNVSMKLFLLINTHYVIVLIYYYVIFDGIVSHWLSPILFVSTFVLIVLQTVEWVCNCVCIHSTHYV